MFKFGLTALAAIPLTFATAQAFDNGGAGRADAAFAQFGVQGLALAGRARGFDGLTAYGPSEGTPAGFYGETLVAPPAYRPVCWTEYLTVAKANILANVPRTICR
jgi:hypothetical protein